MHTLVKNLLDALPEMEIPNGLDMMRETERTMQTLIDVGKNEARQSIINVLLSDPRTEEVTKEILNRG